MCKREQEQTWGDAVAEREEHEPGRVRVDGPVEERERAEAKPVVGTAKLQREVGSSSFYHRLPSLAAGDGG